MLLVFFLILAYGRPFGPAISQNVAGIGLPEGQALSNLRQGASPLAPADKASARAKPLH